MRATMVMVSTHLLEIWPQDGLSRALGAAMPDPAGRADHMALLGIRVRSLNGTNALLGANGIPECDGRGQPYPRVALRNDVALEFIGQP